MRVGFEVGRGAGFDVRSGVTGFSVGLAVGKEVGFDVGNDVGCTVGFDVGSAVGCSVGLEVGSCTGCIVGAEVLAMDMVDALLLALEFDAIQ